MAGSIVCKMAASTWRSGETVYVRTLPRACVQIQAIHDPGSFDTAPCMRLFAMCDDGSIWCRAQTPMQHSNADVGMWERIEAAHGGSVLVQGEHGVRTTETDQLGRKLADRS